MRRSSTVLVLALALALGAGCKRSDSSSAPAPGTQASPPPVSSVPAPLRVSTIHLGNEIGADKRPTAPASAFAPGDTIYAVVLTEGGTPGLTLTARWTYEDGQVVSEDSQTVATPQGAVTEFHIAKPDGWPAGRYKVEIASAGQSLASRDFEVRATP
jgi:hypothetical protein